MIPTTQTVIDAIEERSRLFKARWLKSLDPVEELSCDIMNLSIAAGGGGETPVPGAMFSSYVNCTVLNLEENIKGFEYYLQIGIVTDYDENDEEIISWLPSNGRYTVIKTGVAGERTEFTAVGALTAKSQKAYIPAASGYPNKAIRSVIAELSSATGCTINVKPPLVTTGYLGKPIKGQTCAQALATIASLLGGFVTEDYQGNIVIAAYGSGDTYPVDLTRFSMRPVFTEEPFSVTGLTCDVSEAYEAEVDSTVGGYSYVVGWVDNQVMTGRVFTDSSLTLPFGVYEAGDSIGFDCSWDAHLWFYDADWGYTEPYSYSETAEIGFTYGTADTQTLFQDTDPDTGVNLALEVVYNGAQEITARAVVTVPRKQNALFLGFSANTGPAHYYIQRVSAVSYSSGTPNITIQNEYMTQALFTAAARNYKGYAFTPAELPLTLGNPRLEPWDVLAFTEGEESHTVPCHILTTTFTGGLWQEISSLMAGADDDDADPVTGSLSAKIDQIASSSQVAQAMAMAAQTSANIAQTSATSAQASAASADQSANFAAQRATDADREAVRAGEAADQAQASAANASEYAARALGNLSTVQNVTETLNWITQHGQMTLTTDTALDPTHVYFVQDSAGDYVVGGVHYAVVTEPNASDLSTYYELSINQSLNNYVATHLAVTGEGLWIIPDAGGNKVLIATGQGVGYPSAGTYIIGQVNGVDTVLAQFTQGGAVIGQSGESRLEMDYHSMQLIARGETTPYFWVSDLRDKNDNYQAILTEVFIGDGVKKDFIPSVTMTEGISASDSEDSTNTATVQTAPYGTPYYQFARAPIAGAKITIEYKTNSEYAKAYTLGMRAGPVGAMSVAEGRQTIASGYSSHAEGSGSQAGGRDTHAEGCETVASGEASHAEGTLSAAGGWSSHAEGYVTGATGFAAHAEGSSTLATSNYSHAEGASTEASEYYAHAEGYLTTSMGSASHAEGTGTEASGNSAHAEGFGAAASGDYSHAQNNGTLATHESQTSIGKFNTNQSDTAFEIGNGDSESSRSNAFSVGWDGDMKTALDTAATSGTDKEIYDTLVTLGWDSDVIV